MPHGDKFNGKYAREQGVKTSDWRFLPDSNCTELIREIIWIPITYKWAIN